MADTQYALYQPIPEREFGKNTLFGFPEMFRLVAVVTADDPGHAGFVFNDAHWQDSPRVASRLERTSDYRPVAAGDVVIDHHDQAYLCEDGSRWRYVGVIDLNAEPLRVQQDRLVAQVSAECVEVDVDPVEQMLDDWFRQGGLRQPERDLIVTHSAQSAFGVNGAIQARRGSSADGVTYRGHTFFEGDRVFFADTDAHYRIPAGSFGTVEVAHGAAGMMLLRTDAGVYLPIDTGRYDADLRVGYAVPFDRLCSVECPIDVDRLYASSVTARDARWPSLAQGKDVHVYGPREPQPEVQSTQIDTVTPARSLNR